MYELDQIKTILVSKLGEVYIDKDQYQLRFFCPKCHHHKQKLEVNLKKGIFHCWVCDTEFKGHIFKLCKFLQCSKEEFEIFQKVYSNLKEEEKSDLDNNVVLDLSNEFNSIAFPLIDYSKVLNIQKKKCLNYLINERKITLQDVIKYNIHYGIGEYDNSIMFPSFNCEGVLNYYVIRRIQGKYFKPNISMKNLIFNELYINWNDNIHLVEGLFDQIKIDSNSVVLLNSSLSEKSLLFNKLLNHTKDKYFCLDKDALKRSIEIIKKLLKNGVNNIFILLWNNNIYKDLGEFPTKEQAINFKNSNLEKVTLNNLDYLSIKFSMT